MINHLSTGAGFLPSRITRSSCSQMRHLFLWPTCVKKEERVPCTTNPQMWTWPFRNASILGRKLDVEPKIPKQIINNHYISESRCRIFRVASLNSHCGCYSFIETSSALNASVSHIENESNDSKSEE